MVSIIFVLLEVLMLTAGILLVVLKKLPHLGRVLIMLSALGAALLLLVVVAIALWSSVHQNFYLTVFFIFEVLMMMLLGVLLWGGFKYKFFSIPLCAALACCLLVTGVFYGYQAALAKIATVGESGDIFTRYSPFEDQNDLATLNQPSTLTLTDDLPVLDGATAMYPIYAAFYKATYEEQDMEDLICNTTTGAYYNIVDGNCDMIFVGGPSKEQQEYAEQQGVELVYTPIGREAFVFFVNAQNPLNDITVEQIQEIYSGKTTEWSQLGVKDLGKIRAFQRDEGSGSQSALQRLMGDLPLMDPPKENVVAGMGGIIEKAADYRNYKNAIGYSFRFYSTEMVQNNQIKLLSVNGIAPTEENVANGTYPIASEFYAVTRKDCSENTQKLLQWIQSPQGQELIAKTGYTPLY
ncbi:MAG: substrate-binding domain-containing protein [Clostridia bacterium]|nr:substrate-binding domain-containing protein [Clostridia bacterium]